MLDLKNISRKDAILIQRGLKASGYYHGTTRGFPGPLTQLAYDRFHGPSSEASEIAERMVELAREEVGVREIPKDSNMGQRVEEYQAATWLDDTGWPWCAAFICWLAKKAGMGDGVRPKTPGAWAFEKYAKNNEGVAQLFKPAPEVILPGDIVIFTFSHIGIAVDRSEGHGVATIEGNTDLRGSREGGGVYEKIRNRSQIRSIVRIA